MISKRDAGLKHSQYYADILLQADKLYELGAREIEDGLHLFDINWRNIEIGQKWAVRCAGREEDAATLVGEYPERGARCLYLRQKPADRLVWLESALYVAHARGMELVEGTLHGKIGLAFSEMGEYQRAIEHYSIRLAIAGRFKDNEGSGEVYCNLGILYDNLNLLEKAHECYLQALNLANKISNPRIIEVSTGNLGLLYLKQGEFIKARDCFERHLQLAVQNGDSWSESNALTNAGIANLKLQNYEQARKYIQRSILINKRLGDLEGEAKNLSYQGMICAAVNDLDGAVSAYQSRIAIAQELNDPRGESIGYWNLGEILIKQKKYKLGVEYLNRCLDYERMIDDPAWQEDQTTIRQIEKMFENQNK